MRSGSEKISSMRNHLPDPDEGDIAARNARKDLGLRQMRRVATGFLLLAALIYAISTFLGQLHPAMGYVAAFSEAAVIGAMADWFAVVALFRHPLHLKFIPHTAILPANKQRIAKGLSEFILQNFLSAEAIVAKIAEIGPANKLRIWLLKRENAAKLAALTARFLSYGMSVFDDERVRRFVQAAVTSKLKEIDVAAAAGQVLDVLTENKRHHAVLNEVLRLVDEAMARQETRDYIAKAVAAESPLIDAIRRMGWQLDETIAHKIVNGVARTIEEVRNDPDHALRRRFDEFIAGFIDKLKRDEGTRLKVQRIRDELIRNPALESYIGGLWQEFRAWLASDLANPGSQVHGAILQLVNTIGQKLDADPGIQRWIDEQILEALPALVEENKAKIGKFIEDRINDWHADKFATEMEREIGRDLQFIRINGTVVGGLVGLLIYTVSHALK
jgi:uncharacterized membrane-anchored protein YjiN (DUF445 family)